MKNKRNIIEISLLILAYVGVLTYSIYTKPDIHTPKENKEEVKRIQKSYSVNVTIYNPTKKQCDNTPDITSDGTIVSKNINQLRYIAISQSMLEQNGGTLNYGDTITLLSNNSNISGDWFIHDCLHKRYKRTIDLLQDTQGLKGYWKNVLLIKK